MSLKAKYRLLYPYYPDPKVSGVRVAYTRDRIKAGTIALVESVSEERTVPLIPKGLEYEVGFLQAVSHRDETPVGITKVPRDGLVGEWLFSEGGGDKLYDTSGYENNGVRYGASWLKLPTEEWCLGYDGVDDYAVIEPFTVYGWSEITIAEWVYAFHPKPNAYWSKFSMIGDFWTDGPATSHVANNYEAYTSLNVEWNTRRPDGTRNVYNYNWFDYRNQWVYLVRRFTKDREFSFWINGVKVYSASIPATEKTILEWNPDTATYPECYRRFVLGANSVKTEWMKNMNDEVRIYNRALSEAEISSIFNLERGKYGV